MLGDSASVVMFAVRSAVRLGKEAQTAYADATRRRELTLPLPNFFSRTSDRDAAAFFRNPERGKPFADESEEIQGLLAKEQARTLKPEEAETLRILHIEYANLRRAQRGEATWEGGAPVDERQLNALLTVRQWRRGADPNPSALKRMAGSLVEIGIDYAQTQPDLFDQNSSRGRAMAAFLEGLDDFDFVHTDVSELPARLLVAAIEVTEEIPELVSGDPKLRDLVRTVSSDLGQVMTARIQAIEDSNLSALDRRAAFRNVEDWSQLIFKSSLSSAAELTLSDPERFFGVEGAGGKALISQVGGTFLDLLLDDQGFANALSRDALEQVLDAALNVVSEHPEILIETDNRGVHALVGQLAKDLATLDLQQKGLLGDIAQQVLLRSGENLELLWPDLTTSPQKNLLLAATKKTLGILARPAEEGESWTPSFGKEELLEVSEGVIDELVRNPGWLLTSAGNLSSTLEQALSATVDVLRARGDKRLTPALGAEIVRASLRAVSLRKEFLGKLPADAQRPAQLVVEAAIDLVISSAFDPDLNVRAAWQLARADVVTTLVDEVLQVLARHELGAGAIAKLEEKLDELTERLGAGDAFDLDDFIQALEIEL